MAFIISSLTMGGTHHSKHVPKCSSARDVCNNTIGDSYYSILSNNVSL